MRLLIAFIVGLMAGGTLGILALCLVQAQDQDDWKE